MKDEPLITNLKIKPWNSDSVQSPLPEFNVNLDQTIEGFIKDRIREKLELKNPAPEQIL